VGVAFPDHYYDQQTLLTELVRLWGRQRQHTERVEALHRNVLVGGRHLALPIDQYDALENWGQANDAWIRVAQDVGERAIRNAFEVTGIGPNDIDALIFVTVTGVATPSIDARLVNRMGLRPNVTRIPIFGLGCVAGAAGIARAADFVKAYPDRVAMLLSVELCSLTLQRSDFSVANLVATGLFGDGAAAAVVTGTRRGGDGPRIVASRSIFYPNTERIMGWDVSEGGFRVVLSADVPRMVLQNVRSDVDAFLAEHGLTRGDVSTWISHPGGPKVLEAMQEALDVPAEGLESSWRTLREVGNLSSTSVLLVLKDALEAGQVDPGGYGLMLAMGPGFCSELVLLRWPGLGS
jgi:alkylresorcinol/alkylpyrone synthase